MERLPKRAQRMTFVRDSETIAMVEALEAKLALVTGAVKVGMSPADRAKLDSDLAKVDSGEEPAAEKAQA